ncbi:TetR/AcrR family transcriptional regulator [Xanthomonas sp. PPL139]|uniref:TetR/AcrR family transcriptional regulator n=1 Tax=unclassified Xanthomonas TaxID=2643310 RepID=UPI0033B5BE5A
MNSIEDRSRPGGRSARVRSSVFEAVLHALVTDGFEGLKIRDIAMRAGVNETSIYRRWGTRESLLCDVLIAHSEKCIPMPDTGGVRGDLTALANAIASYLDTPLGGALIRVLAVAVDDAVVARAREAFWRARYEAASVIITRAIARGELPESTNTQLVLEALIAPLHFRTLLTRRSLDRSLPEQLVNLVLNGVHVAVVKT